GSTCGLRTSSEYLAVVAPGEERSRDGAVVVLLDRLVNGDTARVFYKPYYRRDDFDDERYKPTFTPLVYPRQTLHLNGVIEKMSGRRVALAPYVRDASGQQIFQDGFFFPDPDTPFTVDWTLPEVPFAIDEVGLLVMNPDAEKFLGNLVLNEYSITGKRSFEVRFADEKEEFGGLSRCSLVGGAWEMEDEALHVITRDRFQLYSGPYYMEDCEVDVNLIPEHGSSHLLACRARGAEYGYFFGLHGEGRVALIRRDGEDEIVAESTLDWTEGETYRLSATVSTNGNSCDIVCSVNGVEQLRFSDPAPHPYGMAGVGKLGGGRTRFIRLSAKEL
ncbi:MAG: hypothetical protein KAU31_08590, partial [Spirochaetaceae bacterium]|nr:hypothetical protein [Spirochaetaceae bacterium]